MPKFLPIIHHRPIAGETTVARLQPDVPAICFVVEVAPQMFENPVKGAKLLGVVSAKILIALDLG